MRVLRSIVVLAVGFLVALSMSAEAAPTLAPGYVSSEPEDGAMLDNAPEEVSVTFDEPLDPGSELAVTDECGRAVDDGNVSIQANQMSVGIALTPSGDYTVTWLAKGIAGATGQDTGNFSFMVHHGPACDGDDGHGGHNGGNSNGGTGGGNHGGHQGGGGGTGQHSGHQGMSGGSSTDHDSMGDHDSMDGTGTDHDMGSMDHSKSEHAKKKHGMKKHGNRHGKHNRRPTPAVTELGPQADDGGTPAAPNGRDVLVALGLCLALGGVGGWFLRVSGAR